MTVDKSEQRVRAMFGQIARRYDFLNHFLSAGIDRHWRRRAVGAVNRETSGPVLDVCTGTGDLAIGLRRALGNERAVVGVDFTHEMLVLARRKRDSGDYANLYLAEADAQSLPFDDDQFAAVTIAFGLRNVTDPRRGLREMIRVCAPGGQVLVLEFSQPTAPVLGGAYRWYFRRVLPRLGQWISRNRSSAYEYLPASVGEFPSGNALAAIMEECGLDDVTFTPLTFGVATLYRGRKSEIGGRKSELEKPAHLGGDEFADGVTNHPDSRLPTPDSRNTTTDHRPPISDPRPTEATR